jgi:hypothetical protein
MLGQEDKVPLKWVAYKRAVSEILGAGGGAQLILEVGHLLWPV